MHIVHFKMIQNQNFQTPKITHAFHLCRPRPLLCSSSQTTMSLNETCQPGSLSCEPPSGGSLGVMAAASIGSAAVTLLFVAAAVAAVVFFKYRRMRPSTVWRLDNRTHGKPQKADDEQLPGQRAVLHQYTSMGGAEPGSPDQTPIYENFSSQARQHRNPVLSTRGFSEDLYLQCDSVDDAIYSNDPACSLAMLPEPHEGEDLYIIPDAL